MRWIQARRSLSEPVYAVVGCGECSALWVVEGRPETTGCPRCGTSHRFSTLKRFAETDDPAGAKEARAALLAERDEHGAAFDAVEDFAALGSRVADAGVDDAEYLDGMGIDAEHVAAAGERAGPGGSGSGSQLETVREAIRECDPPTEEAIVARVTERGVPEERARKALSKLVRNGAASESRGEYRLL